MEMKVRNLKVVFFGDSITEGQYICPQNRWTDLVTRELKNKYNRFFLEILTYNKGISGETSRQGILRFPKDVQELLPDVITIQFGLNDCNHWNTDRGLPRVSLDAFAANLEEMVDRARLFGVKHIILSNNHRTLKNNLLPGNKNYEDQRRIYNSILQTIAVKKGVIFCDIESWFDTINSSYSEYLLPAPDLLHLSLKGHNHYAKKIFSILEECVEKVLKFNFEEVIEVK